MKKNDWTKRLYDKLADYQEPAPADLWADIEAKLAEKQVAPQRRARVIPMWSKWVAVAAAFVGLLLGNAYLMWKSDQEETASGQIAEVSKKPVQEYADEPALPVSVAEQVSTIGETPLVAQVKSAIEGFESDVVKVVVSEGKPEQQPVSQISEQKSSEQAQPQPANTSKETHVKKTLPSDEDVIRQLDLKIAEAVKHRDSHVGLGLYAQSGFVNQLSTSGVMMSPSRAADYVNASNRPAATRGENSNIIYLEDIKEQQKHYQPISFGLTTNIPISSRISLTTGLVYTRLRSDLDNVTAGATFHREQTLHYIGIPVSAQYLIWNYKGLNVYALAGGQADYNFSAKMKTEGVSNDIDRDRMQFSVQGAVGVQYDFIPEFGVYVEPGVKYYFDNGSNMRNFFKDTPTNFNLQLGLRLNLGRL